MASTMRVSNIESPDTNPVEIDSPAVFNDTVEDVDGNPWGIVSGSNANGSWIKFPDGTMEQWGMVTVNAYPTLVTFPQDWISAAGVSFSSVWHKPSVTGRMANEQYEQRTVSRTYVWVYGTSTEATGFLDWHAIGRWK